MATNNADIDVNDLIIEHDTGARNPRGFAGKLLLVTALVWSLFQLWIASPLPFEFGFFILNSSESRPIHLAFALFLGFLAYPMTRSSPRSFIPIYDWVMAIIAAICSLYLFVFYEELSARPGAPIAADLWVSALGILLLLEASRRSLGLPLMMMGVVFLLYAYFGDADWVPDLLSHRGQSLVKISNHQWLSSGGVFGIALGVSNSFVFLFVLFGALLDKAGAGNYFIKVAFSLLGHLRGGPAKAAVLSSGLTGFISGSSIANVVTTGTFTVPLMRKVGFSAEKAGAVEVASSVNGQIMPPVMGAAAFIMIEYVGLPYQEIIKHAFLPAIISYIALLYMVHLEALKHDAKALEKPIKHTPKQRFIYMGVSITSILILAGMVYYGVLGAKAMFGESAPYVIGVVVFALYVALVKYASNYPDLEVDDPDKPMVVLPQTALTVKTGLHYLIPVIVLIWCLMVERLSAGLSAFWACVIMMIILVTQHAFLAWFRKHDVAPAFKQGIGDVKEGLISGARNMIAIAIATAAAGIIVGVVSQTGLANVMKDLVDTLAGDSLMLVLIFTALISLVLGMGLPTTANYLVVATMMAGVVMELGRQHGLIVPAIAVHLFVFYFGIMADVTPPVGLASFAAAAISKGDPIRTGLQAFIYSTRTAILPFFFIFNTELLLIGIESIWHGLWVFATATAALLLYSAGTQGFFLVSNRLFESLILVLVSVMLFVPGFFLNQVYDPYNITSGDQFLDALEAAEPGDEMKLQIEGNNKVGRLVDYYILFDVPEGETVDQRLDALGVKVEKEDDHSVFKTVVYNSVLKSQNVNFFHKIEQVLLPADQPNKYVVYVPALALLLMVYLMQRHRRIRILSND